VQYFVHRADYIAGRLDRGFLDYAYVNILTPLHSRGRKPGASDEKGKGDKKGKGDIPIPFGTPLDCI
jgi:hypothetical protein